MTKAEIVKKIHTRTGIRRSDVNAIVDGFLSAIKSNMVQGHNIYLRGFGTFSIRRHKGRKAYSINNAAFITIPPHTSPTLKPGKELACKTR